MVDTFQHCCFRRSEVSREIPTACYNVFGSIVCEPDGNTK